MAVAVWTSFQQISNSSGTPYSGAKVNVYAATTTTPLTLYSDSGLSVTVANPIVCDSSGQHAMVYIATASYKTSVTDSSGTPLTNWSKDNIDPGVAVGSGALPVASGGTGATTAGAARTNLGVPATATVTAIASDVTTLQGYHTGTAALKVATGTTAQRSGSPSDYDVRGNTTITSPEIYLGGTWHKISFAPPVVSFQKLSIGNNAGTPNSKVDLTADTLVLCDSNNASVRINSASLTIDCSTTGANALDAGALANSTWYYVWVIFNPATGTVAGLISTSATSPTMPSGYTFKGRFGAFVTNGSAQFHRISQKGRRAQYVISASITTLVPVIANGTAGTFSATNPVLASASITGVVPTTATVIHMLVTNRYGAGAASDVLVAPNTSYGGTGNGPIGSSGQTWPAYVPSTISNHASASFTIEGTTIGWASNAAGGGVTCLGWDDNI